MNGENKLSYKGEQMKEKLKEFFDEHKDEIGAIVEFAWPYVEKAIEEKIKSTKTKVDDYVWAFLEPKLEEFIKKLSAPAGN